jgi:hypothetical protein
MDAMPKNPWGDPDPQPGDFDAELDRASQEQIDIRNGNRDAKLIVLGASLPSNYRGQRRSKD